ncbi:phosphate-starvation-inducible PsiE family protein [Actinophytocola sp.]|jgi:uncharacterized membrane protein (DUF373 family)|uniref:phosphate-starvation-inducible PsiE family protein n=1 Tax=Actinophytocola sp. TaxID=1872138 RepID=UPI002ED9FB48
MWNPGSPGGRPDKHDTRSAVAVRGKRIERVLRIFGAAEDAIHVLVAILLVGLAAGLLGGAVVDVVRALRGQHVELPVALAILDKTLVLFIVAELLHSVRITIEHGGRLNAEPFLVVGLISGVRRVLVLTAEAEVSFRWNPQGIELSILAALILAMALAILIWRRSTRRGEESTEL